MMRYILCLFLIGNLFYGHTQTTEKEKVYNINWWLDGGITLAAMAGNYGGLAVITQRKGLDSAFVLSLDPMDINAFDRPATMVDPEFARRADELSDIGLSSAFVLPGLLAIDPKIRKDFGRVVLLYLEAGFGAGTIYAWGGAIPFERIRPIAYNDKEVLAKRTTGFLRNSFYSGHVAQTAVATFFMAKVLSDYHPEWKNKRWLLYGAASLLPAGVGFMRYKAGKHFTSDILVGFTIGAAMGILIPELHRNKPDRKLSLGAATSDINGLSLRWKF